MDFNIATRLIAITSIFVGLGFTTDEFDRAWAEIYNEDQPNTVAEVGKLVDKLTLLRAVIDAEKQAAIQAELAADPKDIKRGK